MEATPRQAPPLADPETAIATIERVTPHGPVWVAHATYADLHRHGRAPVSTARAWDAAGLARLAREPQAAPVPLEGWAFLDLETTGLGMQAGTLAFLVGIGWMESSGFHLEQFLLRDPSDEPALLHAVSECLGRFAAILTFNGKAFDMPLLKARFAMVRGTAPAGRPHCDLLHVARRVWSERGTSCRLGALETALLGMHRRGDVDGGRIPDIYFEYLRQGDGASLDPVLAHNRHDLVSLLLLAAEASRFLARARRGEADLLGRGHEARELAADRLRAARAHWWAGDRAAAVELLDACLAGSPEAGPRMAARSLLAYIRKRQGDLDSACRLWEEMLGDDPDLVEPIEELAKVHEHRRHDPVSALVWVDRRLAGAPMDPASSASLQHRRNRLLRRGAGTGRTNESTWGLGLPGA